MVSGNIHPLLACLHDWLLLYLSCLGANFPVLHFSLRSSDYSLGALLPDLIETNYQKMSDRVNITAPYPLHGDRRLGLWCCHLHLVYHRDWLSWQIKDKQSHDNQHRHDDVQHNRYWPYGHEHGNDSCHNHSPPIFLNATAFSHRVFYIHWTCRVFLISRSVPIYRI